METITFQLPPLAVRVRAAAVVAIALVAQGLAVFELPWFTATFGGEPVVVELLRVRDAPLLETGGGAAYYAVMIAMGLVGLAYLPRVIHFGVALLRGHPTVRRGLFRSKLIVGWLTPRRAHVFTGLLLALASVATFLVPVVKLASSNEEFPAALTRSFGGFVLIGGLVLMHVAIAIVARDPRLAATQAWEIADDDVVVTTSPPPRERPMLASRPPASPPTVEADPFRAPPAVELESRLVRPSAAPTAAPRADDPTGDEPSLLR